jgi:hypothetical protein
MGFDCFLFQESSHMTEFKVLMEAIFQLLEESARGF